MTLTDQLRIAAGALLTNGPAHDADSVVAVANNPRDFNNALADLGPGFFGNEFLGAARRRELAGADDDVQPNRVVLLRLANGDTIAVARLRGA